MREVVALDSPVCTINRRSSLKHLKRHVAVSAVLVLAVLSVLTVAAVAAVPGTYKGSLYQAGVKVANAPATISVVGTKVTITAPRLPIKCQAADGTYTMASDPIRYVFKGTRKGNLVNANYAPPLGGTGEYFTAKGRFVPASKSFVGTLTFTGRCQGTAAVRAKKR